MPITSEAEYQSALAEINELWDVEDANEPRFMELVDAVVVYEEEHYPIEKPSLWARFEYWLYRKGWLT